jgi:hypothetical protein
MRIRKQITLSPVVYAAARDLMKRRLFTQFSGFVEELIRERWAAEQDQAGLAAPGLNDTHARYRTTKPAKPTK